MECMYELTPDEVFVGRKPVLSHLKVFRSIMYLHITSEKGVLVGYLSEKKGYKCFNPSTRAVRVSRGLVFDESASWYEPD